MKKKSAPSSSASETSSKKDESKKKKTKKVYSRFQHSPEALKDAVREVRNQTLSINKASKTYNIPKGTLVKKLHNNEDSVGKMGPKTVLTEEEEQTVVDWIIQKAEIGCPMHPRVVKCAIKRVLDCAPRKNPFKNNFPGEKWFRLFLGRHPEVKLKNTEVLSKSRASVTEENIRDWFSSLKAHLEKQNVADILQDPSRIYNMDETAVQLCPKTGKLLAKSNEKNNYYISPGQEKESITVLCSYGANGRSVRPMIVYPYKRFPPKDVAASVPEGYVLAHSPKGWMTAEAFHQFIEHGFYKQLVEDKVKFPVLLLLDGHSSHMSMPLSTFCVEKQIILYCLYPNATHLIQPCDVAIFRPLKKSWQKKVALHGQISNSVITKATFAPLFNEAFTEASDPSLIKKAFECCGLYPFNPDAPNYSKCISTRRREIKKKELDLVEENSHEKIDSSALLLNNLEDSIPKHVLSMFRIAHEKNAEPESEIILYGVWKKLKTSKDGIIESNSEQTSSGSLDNNQSERVPSIPTDQGDEVIPFTDTSDNIIVEDFASIVSYHDLEVIVCDDDLSNLVHEVHVQKETISQECSSHDDNPVNKISLTASTPGSTQIDLVLQEQEDTFINTLQLAEEKEETTPSSLIFNQDESTEEAPLALEVLDQSTNNTDQFQMNNQNKSSKEAPSALEVPNLSTNNNDQFQTDNQNKSSEEAPSALEVLDQSTNNTDQFQTNNQNKSSEEVPSALEVLNLSTDNSNQSQTSNINLDSQSIPVNESENSKTDLNSLWRKELHFPEIRAKKKAKSRKPMILAITSEEWQKQQNEKIKKQEELQRLKELRKYEREMKKKIKQEEDEMKKKERLKIKKQQEILKQETEAKMQLLLKKRAESLNLSSYELPKKRKVLKNITNDNPVGASVL